MNNENDLKFPLEVGFLTKFTSTASSFLKCCNGGVLSVQVYVTTNKFKKYSLKSFFYHKSVVFPSFNSVQSFETGHRTKY